MESLKDGEDGSLQGLLRFIVRIGDSLDSINGTLISFDLCYKPGYSPAKRQRTQRRRLDSDRSGDPLGEAVRYSRVVIKEDIRRLIRTNLYQFLILFPVRVLQLLICGNVVLEITNGMLPCAQALLKELRNLARLAKRPNRVSQTIAPHWCPRREWHLHHHRCPGTTLSERSRCAWAAGIAGFERTWPES